MLALIGFLVLGLVIAAGAMTLYTAYMLTHPARRTYASALAANRPGDPGELAPGPTGVRAWKAWRLETGGGALPVWEIEGDDPGGPVIVLSHGWGDSRVGALSRVAHLAPLASRLIAWDMPGHGEAPGTCALGTREARDLRALVERVPDGRVVLYGWSLGAGVSIAAAAGAGPEIVGVIAEAPYRMPATPARNVHRALGLPHRVNLPAALGLLGMRFGVGAGFRGFDRAALAPTLRCPLLVIHGERDDVCPAEDGRAIARAAGDATFVEVPGAGHHGLWTTPVHAARCAAAVGKFLARVAGNGVSTIAHGTVADG